MAVPVFDATLLRLLVFLHTESTSSQEGLGQVHVRVILTNYREAVLARLGQFDPSQVHRYETEALVDAGANVNLPDRSGETPLALAKKRGFSEMAKILESAGAP